MKNNRESVKDFDITIRCISVMAESHDSALALIKPVLSELENIGNVKFEIEEKGEWL